ncbi:protein SODIUM POTASSIUM ROOT DEFECTIVE 1-like [Olea europaea var. sylvestris]|uniref:protein SODIUM POTASSIUM ROOT DEFECTIVE 1-like n=1 Tax=Olea europaea var. sylvestris TaxID=158386 RepID=UPI000C1D8B81|nr:protein SODIUM POTASSIUM ROOT DEFECTIVE 1-like [Olea europaea var. sylvestris]
MKSIDLFCASPAATAICSSMDQRATVPHGMKALDRHIHRLGDRPKSRAPPPCSSQLPIDPRTYYQRNRKSSSKESELLRRKSSAEVNDPGSSRYLLSDKPFLDFISDSERISALVPINQPVRTKRMDSDEFPIFKSSSTRSNESTPRNMLVKKYTNPVFKSSATDSNDNMLVKQQHTSLVDKSLSTRSNDTHAQKKPPSTRLNDHLDVHKSTSNRSSHRNLTVVELRVSIHCKGCEGKLRKHISRMEGVTSFNIDLPTKKVTVIGDVTPLGVLMSISKVKNAQFWPSPTSSSSSSSPK